MFYLRSMRHTQGIVPQAFEQNARLNHSGDHARTNLLLISGVSMPSKNPAVRQMLRLAICVTQTQRTYLERH